MTLYWVCRCLPFSVCHLENWLEATSRADVRHMLVPKSDVALATLLPMAMEIWDPECRLFGQHLAIFAFLGQVGKTIFPWDREPGQKNGALLVADEEGSIALGFRFCSSGPVRVTQFTPRATLPILHFLVFSAPSCDCSLGEQ